MEGSTVKYRATLIMLRVDYSQESIPFTKDKSIEESPYLKKTMYFVFSNF